MTTFEGKVTGRGLHIGIVVSRFNGTISERLLAGALDGLRRHDVPDDFVDVAWVPGAFELPLTAQRMAATKKYDAVVCLGAVIRGATPHFDYVAGPTAGGIAAVSRESGLPVIFGVLTTETIEQAIERSGTKAGNKGYDAVVAAIEMANLLQLLPGSG